jgi:hypothetical protein
MNSDIVMRPNVTKIGLNAPLGATFSTKDMMMNNIAEIGHNQPPEPIDPYLAMAAHIGDLLEMAEGALHGQVIETPEQAAQIAELKDAIKKAEKDADKARDLEKRPHLEAGREIDGKWKPLIERARLARKVASEAETPWLSAQQAIRDQIALEKRMEAQRLTGEALAAFTNSSPTDLDARFEAEAKADMAKKATAIANKVDRTASGLRSYTIATVDDHLAFLNWVKKHRPHELKEWLNQYAQSACSAGAREMNGVSIKIERRAV